MLGARRRPFYRSHPRAGDLQNKYTLRLSVAFHLSQLNHQAQGSVNGSCTEEGSAHVRVQENEVRPCVIALGVLAAHATLEQLAEIVFRAQVIVRLILPCFHRLFFLFRSGLEH
jgi:hypothetical protein